MAGLSGNGEALVLNALLTGRFISLHTADPSNTGAAEVAGGAYARQAGGTFNVTGANPSTAANAAVIQFPTATAAWGTINYYGIWSAASGGTFYGGFPVATPKAIGIDDIVRWDAGKLKVSADDIL